MCQRFNVDDVDFCSGANCCRLAQQWVFELFQLCFACYDSVFNKLMVKIY
jgi:hypothetical protein